MLPRRHFRDRGFSSCPGTAIDIHQGRRPEWFYDATPPRWYFDRMERAVDTGRVPFSTVWFRVMHLYVVHGILYMCYMVIVSVESAYQVYTTRNAEAMRPRPQPEPEPAQEQPPGGGVVRPPVNDAPLTTLERLVRCRSPPIAYILSYALFALAFYRTRHIPVGPRDMRAPMFFDAVLTTSAQDAAHFLIEWVAVMLSNSDMSDKVIWKYAEYTMSIQLAYMYFGVQTYTMILVSWSLSIGYAFILSLLIAILLVICVVGGVIVYDKYMERDAVPLSDALTGLSPYDLVAAMRYICRLRISASVVAGMLMCTCVALYPDIVTLPE